MDALPTSPDPTGPLEEAGRPAMDTVAALLRDGGAAARRGDWPCAVERIGRAVDLDPGRAESHNLLGQVYAMGGAPQRALAAFETAVRLDPELAEAQYNLGLALKILGRQQGAAERFEKAAALRPDWSEAHFHRANVLAAMKDWPAAVDGYRRALDGRPESPEIHFNLGYALQVQGRYAEAKAAYTAAILRRPTFAMALNNLGVVLDRLGEPAAALDCYRRALVAAPDDAETHNSLCIALERRDRLDEALAHGRRAVCLKPDFAEAYNSLGVALNALGRRSEATAAFGRALDLRPAFTEPLYNRAVLRLLQGDFRRGWKDYESRLERPEWTYIHPYRYRRPRWQGEPFAGRRLYVHDEQGFGDTIQFVRYLSRVKDLGGTVILETRRPLVRLLQGVEGVDAVVERPAAPEPAAGCDLVVALMSLARIFGTTAETIPAQIPYLRGDPRRIERWRRVVGTRGFRVGLIWCGSPNHEQDRRRSIPLEAFADLGRVRGVRLFGLQKGEAAREAGGKDFLEANLGDRLNDFADTAAAMAALDLVVSVDTAAAHLAGAVGKAVWTLIPSVPDWRWGLSGDTTPWYPQMTLFRQARAGAWGEVIDRMVRALARRMGAAAGGPDLDRLRERFETALYHRREGRAEEAERLCREILAAVPNHAETLNLAAAVARDRGALKEAAAMMARAVAAAPHQTHLHRNRGRILEETGDLAAATLAFEQALDQTPTDRAALGDLARVLAAGGHLERAEAVCRRLLAVAPTDVAGLNRFGTVLGRRGCSTEAMTAFDRALACDPHSADAWTNKGALLHAAGRLDEAEQAFDRALAAVPDHVAARFNRAQLRLLTGDFAGGWPDYEARLQKAAWRRRRPGLEQGRPWRGEPLEGARIFVYDEQGLGDTLQFVRYLPLVEQRGGRVVLCAAAALTPVLTRVSGADRVVAGTEPEPAPGPGERFVSLLSLPGIFGTGEADIPCDIPYLRAEPERAARWKEKMPAAGLRAGLVWAGSPAHANDRRRSCPLERLAPLLTLAGVSWFGLQKGERARQVSALAPELHFVNFGDDLNDFGDTAAVMANLDLVVTVDTAAAHLAGAMGRPVWVLLPPVPDWRWQLEREDSPWYPTMRLFRRRPGEGWGPVAARVATALEALQARSDVVSCI